MITDCADNPSLSTRIVRNEWKNAKVVPFSTCRKSDEFLTIDQYPYCQSRPKLQRDSEQKTFRLLEQVESATQTNNLDFAKVDPQSLLLLFLLMMYRTQ